MDTANNNTDKKQKRGMSKKNWIVKDISMKDKNKNGRLMWDTMAQKQKIEEISNYIYL